MTLKEQVIFGNCDVEIWFRFIPNAGCTKITKTTTMQMAFVLNWLAKIVDWLYQYRRTGTTNLKSSVGSGCSYHVRHLFLTEPTEYLVENMGLASATCPRQEDGLFIVTDSLNGTQLTGGKTWIIRHHDVSG